MSTNDATETARRALERRVAAFTLEERQEAARQETARLEAARLEAERQEAARSEAARRDADARALVIAGEVAAATAALHAQAAAILNIKSLVLVVLDLTSPHFNRWRGLFLNTLERYALADHVLSNDDRSDDVTWKRMDCVVLSWLYGTITADLLEVVMNREDGPPTARIVWLGLEQQFIGNKETRALLLDAEFRTFVQGDLSIDDYCRHLKAMADQLADLGEPVRDRTLVLNVLRGLNDRFAHLAALIQRQRPFPTFIEVRSDLRLTEITMKAKQGSPAQALTASTPRAPPPIFHNHVAGSNSGKKHTRRGGGGGKKFGTAGAGPAFPAAPWAHQAQRPTPPPPGWQPAYGTFQAYWAGPPGAPPRTPGQSPQVFYAGQPPLAPLPGPPLAPLPGPPPPLAPLPGPLHAQSPAPGFAGPPAPHGWISHPDGFAWDQNALASSFNTMTLQSPPSTEWYMDTGAETHMTSNSGPQNPERDRQVQ